MAAIQGVAEDGAAGSSRPSTTVMMMMIYIYIYTYTYTLWLFDIAMEDGPIYG